MPATTLITNVNVFDGKSEKLIEKANVLILDNMIKTISTKTIAANGATVIDGGGRTLMPGLIDAHVRIGPNMPIETIIREPSDYFAALDRCQSHSTNMFIEDSL